MDGTTISSSVADIQAAIGAAAGNQTNTKEVSDLSSRDDFLNMLVIQLRNQDPLNPMESQEFAVQLAQFSQVEGLLNIQETLEKGQQSDATVAMLMNNLMTTSLLGKDVLAATDIFVHEDGGESILQFELPEDASNVTVEIRNTAGVLVESIDLGPKASGMNSMTWDGMDNEGNSFSAGSYQFKVKAYNTAEEEMTATPFNQGRVTGISVQEGVSLLHVNGVPIPAAYVREIREPEN